jgi:hypothetical protein
MSYNTNTEMLVGDFTTFSRCDIAGVSQSVNSSKKNVDNFCRRQGQLFYLKKCVIIFSSLPFTRSTNFITQQ